MRDVRGSGRDVITDEVLVVSGSATYTSTAAE